MESVRIIPTVTFIIFNTLTSAQPLEFRENFDDNINGWSVFSNNIGESTIAEGNLKINNKSNRALLNLIDHYINPNEDFTIVTSLSHLNGSGNFGLSWGALGNISFFSFNIFADSSYNVVSNKEGNFFEIFGKQKLPNGLFQSGQPLILKIIKKGIEIALEVNGHFLNSSMFMNFFGTEIGFSVEPGVSMYIDYLEIYQPEVVINLATTSHGFEKENLGPQINSIFAENGVMISPDGSEMYVVRNGHPGNMGQMKKDDIWRSSLDENGEWSRLSRMGNPLNNNGSNFVISVAPDRNTLLLANTYNEDGTSAGPGLSMANKNETGWEVPKEVRISGFQNISQYVDFCLSPDRQALVMSIDNGKGIGGMDLLVSFREEEGWSVPVNMGDNINSFANDFTPFIAADNSTLYFASFGHPGYGSADIYVSRRLDDTWTFWSEPENLGPDINTKSWDANLSIPAKGDYAYLTSNENSVGDIDIFKIKLHQSQRPRPVILIRGKVIDAMTNEGVAATINYYDLFNGRFLGEATSDPANGSYRIVLPVGESYSFLAQKQGFYSISENIDALGMDSYNEIERDLFLGPIKVGSTIRLNNIFFETARFNLKYESHYELDRLINLMNEYPGMRIEISGHTDNEGVEKYNQDLSEKRAKEVFDYLLPYLNEDRLSFKGYGESLPVADNQTEEGKRINRRVEFRILELKEN
ncbi:MAG: OmpA family protein [Bacteroidetes bacterium]|nr:OmpA family protein [Bacteroidota bacterium]MDA1119071.1 OmpA family protein [Bacteroidota bacterium]